MKVSPSVDSLYILFHAPKVEMKDNAHPLKNDIFNNIHIRCVSPVKQN